MATHSFRGTRKSNPEARRGQTGNTCQKALWLPAFPWGASGKESTCQYRGCKRHRFGAWVGKIPWQPSPVFLPGKFHGQEPGGLQSIGSQSWTWPTDRLTDNGFHNSHHSESIPGPCHAFISPVWYDFPTPYLCLNSFSFLLPPLQLLHTSGRLPVMSWLIIGNIYLVLDPFLAQNP